MPDKTMDRKKTLSEHLKDLSAFDKFIIIGSLIAAGFVLIDPLFVKLVRELDPSARQFFRKMTDFGKSDWILIPTGLAVIALFFARPRISSWRWKISVGYLISLAGFIFVSVAGAGLTASLIKNIIGRARPKHFDKLGPIDFSPFSFTYDFASFPSGHATTIFAFCTAIALLWPKVRVAAFAFAAWIAATRFLIGSHYITDTIAGGFLGTFFVIFTWKWFAAKRWLFEIGEGGRIILRGRRLMRWIVKNLRRFILQEGGISRHSRFSGNS